MLDFTRSAYAAAFFAVEEGHKNPDAQCAIWAIDVQWIRDTAGLLLSRRANYEPISDVFTPPRSETADFFADFFGKPERKIDQREAIFRNALIEAFATDNLPKDPWFTAAFLEGNPRLVFPVEPEIMSERLFVQQGTFLCTGDIRLSFMRNLSAMRGWQDHVRKYTMPSRERPSALRNLLQMNISRASLFPGLEGFGQSLRHRLVGFDGYESR